MMNQEPIQIKTYEDLLVAKQFLKSEIKKQEASFQNNPLFKISKSLHRGGSLKSSIKNPLASLNSENYFKVAESLLSTILFANKKTRSIFIGYVIAKEMIPFTLQKINELLNRK